MTIGKNCYWCGNKHRGYGFGEWRFFWWKLTSFHVHLKFSAYFFFGIKKTPTLKISTNQLPPWTITTWNIPAHVFKYSGPRFLAYFSLMLPLSLILLKRLFCNSMFQKCWSFYVCEDLSKRSVKWRKTIDEMGGNIPGKNFLGGSFPGGNFLGGSLMGGNSRKEKFS